MAAASYTLSYSLHRSTWALRDDRNGTVVREFISRHAATDPDTLRALVGAQAPVRIGGADGRLFAIVNDGMDEAATALAHDERLL